jgi:LytS/YehU family sensor histidine kinase
MWGTVGAFAMAVSLTTFSMTMNRVLAPLPGTALPQMPELVQWVLIWFGYCLAWTGTHLALTYHWEVEDQQRRTAALVELAQEAQIAALRYQVNPHFLFNTLNSISALVMEQRNDDAETMLLNLCAFVRTTFAKDPRALIPLSEEIGLQRLYLGVEETRFSERMKVQYEIPDDLAGARVPTLILQPLVENALRHGVGESETMTVIRISARRQVGRLHLVVEDDGAGARKASAGGGEGGARDREGVGLNNVRDRLRVHFGEDASFEAKPRRKGGFRVDITLPLQVAA